jgi:hypothetical protein
MEGFGRPDNGLGHNLLPFRGFVLLPGWYLLEFCSNLILPTPLFYLINCQKSGFFRYFTQYLEEIENPYIKAFTYLWFHRVIRQRARK